MATYTIRVELKGNPTRQEYDKLHAAMEAESFKRTIKDSDGVEYHLPTAEYSFDKPILRKVVLARAKRIAATIGREFCVLVTESKGRTWHNLERVKRATRT